MLTLKKLLIFLAGLLCGWFPPEAVAMLMEPPPGEGRPPTRLEPLPVQRHPMAPSRHDRRPAIHRRASRHHDH